MVKNLKQQMDRAESAEHRWREDGLLSMLTETSQELDAVRRLRDHHKGEMRGQRMKEPGGGDGVEEGSREEERACTLKILEVLKELSVSQSDRMAAWRGALTECAHMLAAPPPGGSDQQHPSTTDAGCDFLPCSDSLRDAFISVGVDVQNIMDKLSSITSKLVKEILQLRTEAAQEARHPETPEQHKPETNHLVSHDPLQTDSRPKQDTEDGDDGGQTLPPPGPRQASDPGSSDCSAGEKGEELLLQSEASQAQERVPGDGRTDLVEQTRPKVRDNEGTGPDWVIVGLGGHQEDGRSDVLDACFIRAPPGVAAALRCEVADALSCLMVTGSEELLSHVIRVEVRDGASLRFPVTVAVPFCSRYRGNYRDVAVKIAGQEGRSSYITPVTTEGACGGQRGSFAEVRVYSLGLFAVISRLKRETFTVPAKGLSLKLSMDPRVCLNYLPGSFRAPVVVQTVVQPLDAALLAAVKSRSDAYHPVVSTSPVLYLTHPSAQLLRRPLTLHLPCPPNPDRKRQTRGRGDAPPARDRPAASPRRTPAASVKSGGASDELLVALGSKDKQWSVLDDVPVRNLPNGLVSFELVEIFDRLLVVRLLSQPQPGQLASLAEELEESAGRHSVTVVVQRRQEEPHAVLVAALHSRDLSWELSKLRAQGYGGVPETSAEISMSEGEQLLLRFGGNITSTSFTAGEPSGPRESPQHRLTFHSQLRNVLLLRLTEVDPFGNYSSPHHKGTAIFYRVTRGQLGGQGAGLETLDVRLLGEPVCKLALTLPKTRRSIDRPTAARMKPCDETDSLSDSLLLWLSRELSEEEVALLVLSLRLRRSAAQLVKLRAGDSLPSQAYHVLATWRRALPVTTHQPKASQLAQCLARSGRPDLARELLLRQAAATTQGSLTQGGVNPTELSR